MFWLIFALSFPLIWWLIFFLTLPFGLKGHDRKPIEGQQRGAPNRPLLGWKLLLTSLATLLLSAFVAWIGHYYLWFQ